MQLDGSLSSNLRAAVASAERLRGHPVHKDPLALWRELLAHARSSKRLTNEHPGEVEALIAELQALLAQHEERG